MYSDSCGNILNTIVMHQSLVNLLLHVPDTSKDILYAYMTKIFSIAPVTFHRSWRVGGDEALAPRGGYIWPLSWLAARNAQSVSDHQYNILYIRISAGPDDDR
jgi:hypothetical protein